MNTKVNLTKRQPSLMYKQLSNQNSIETWCRTNYEKKHLKDKFGCTNGIKSLLKVSQQQ